MNSGKSSVLTFAEKCKNILASNWQGSLNTIKADAQGSKGEIYTSKVKYFSKKGKPYIWVPEKDLHNVAPSSDRNIELNVLSLQNTIIDERASFAVTSPFPGPLVHILKSIKKLPARVAMLGDVVRLEDEKAELAAESLRGALLSEQRILKESSSSVTGILNSSYPSLTSRNANLQDLLQGNNQHSIYRFNISSCTYIDHNGGAHEVNPKDIEKYKADPLSSFSMSLIDGVNQSEMRRRALVLFCITFLKENAKDVFLLSVDRKGFDVLGKMKNEGWKELRFTFKDDACDIHTFCRNLLEMEEEALKIMSSFSGL